MRYRQPLLMVCDRENRRLCHFDLDGKYVGTVTQHLRRPCQVSFSGDYAVVSELEGRVTVLDVDNVPIAFLGDNPQTWETEGRGEAGLPVKYIKASRRDCGNAFCSLLIWQPPEK